MKMTKKQAKIILIVGWSICAVVYLACMILCIMQQLWMQGCFLLLSGVTIIVEYRRYIKRIKQKK